MMFHDASMTIMAFSAKLHVWPQRQVRLLVKDDAKTMPQKVTEE